MLFLATTLGILLAGGCTIRHEVDAHVTVDVNLRVDRKLDNLLSYEDEMLGQIEGSGKNTKDQKGNK